MDDLNTGPFDSSSLPKDFGNYLVAVMEIEIGASQGVKASEPWVLAWDEL